MYILNHIQRYISLELGTSISYKNGNQPLLEVSS